jgi:putative FmdB family regulatory protein
MPLYTYKCLQCGRVEDAYRSISERDNGPECHGKMPKIIVPTMIGTILGVASNPGYTCPVTGEFVTDTRRRKEIIREHNLIEKG